MWIIESKSIKMFNVSVKVDWTSDIAYRCHEMLRRDPKIYEESRTQFP